MSVKQYLGVDMAKHSFDVAFDDETPIKTFPNTFRGLVSFFRTISALHTSKEYLPSSIHIGVESTSHYHLLLCMRAKEQGYTPVLINPLITNKYGQRNIRKTKTDKIDARIIRYCAAQGEGYVFNETAQTLTLKHLVRDREYLAKLKWILTMREQAAADKSIAAHSSLPSVSKDILACIKDKMKETEAHLRKYRRPEQTLLQTIPGVGPLTSAACISEIQDIRRFVHSRQLIAFIGIDPKVHQSGSSIDKYRRISKRGSTILRTRLYNAASVAVLRPNQFHTYFQKKRSEGKPYRVCLVAVMNKMVRVIHAVWRSGKAYHE